MSILKLTTIAAFATLPALAAYTQTGAVAIPAHVELSTEERSGQIAELSTEERVGQIAELSTEERAGQIAELSTEERGGQIAELSSEERGLRVAGWGKTESEQRLKDDPSGSHAVQVTELSVDERQSAIG